MISILLAGTLLFGAVAQPVGTCHEDEVAWTVDYRTEGAFEDAHGVTRVCVPMDDLIAEWESAAEERGWDNGYDAGSWDGYEVGHADGYQAGWDAASAEAGIATERLARIEASLSRIPDRLGIK